MRYRSLPVPNCALETAPSIRVSAAVMSRKLRARAGQYRTFALMSCDKRVIAELEQYADELDKEAALLERGLRAGAEQLRQSAQRVFACAGKAS